MSEEQSSSETENVSKTRKPVENSPLPLNAITGIAGITGIAVTVRSRKVISDVKFS